MVELTVTSPDVAQRQERLQRLQQRDLRLSVRSALLYGVAAVALKDAGDPASVARRLEALALRARAFEDARAPAAAALAARHARTELDAAAIGPAAKQGIGAILPRAGTR